VNTQDDVSCCTSSGSSRRFETQSMTLVTATFRNPNTVAVTRSNDYSSHLFLHIIFHRVGTPHFIGLPRKVISRCANYC
jgi:hypothetical protein